MQRRDFIKLGTLAGATGFGFRQHLEGQSEDTRLNLLFIQTDQQRSDTLGSYGNARIQTPHLDSLAERSFRFESCYVTQPLCSPARGSILTGLYPPSHGTWANNIPLSSECPILPEMIRDPDYIAGHIGKWHLGDEVFRQRGFKFFESTESDYYRWYGADRNPTELCGYSRFLIEQGIPPDTRYGHSRDLANHLPVELSKPAYIAKTAIEFLEDHCSRPFVLYLSFLDPHNFADHPTGPPFRNHNDHLYPPAEMEIPSTFYEPMDPTVSYLKRAARVAIARGELPVGYPRTEEELKQAKARYWGLVTLVDTMVGRVLQRLRELQLENRTIIVFTSDHGEMMGDHRLLSKASTYEEAVKVPLLMSIPGLSDRPITISKPVSHIDLVPTLLELLHQPRPASLQGTSWVASLRQGTVPDRDVFFENASQDWLFSSHTCRERCIVTSDGWKMSISDLGDGELYDLKRDPRERKNLYFDSAHRHVVSELRARIKRWQAETNDRVTIDLDQKWPEIRGG